MEDDLEAVLAELEGTVGALGFKERAKAFEVALKRARLPSAAHQTLWDRYQGVWNQRKRIMAERERASETAVAEYKSRLYALDFNHDGGPILQDFSDWERVGDKTRAAREHLEAIVGEIKHDRRLFRNHRDEVFGLVRDIRSGINSVADTARSVHDREARSILNEVTHAIVGVSARDARALLKAAQAHVFSLYLSHEMRSIQRSVFDELWAQINARADEERTQWRERQENGLAKLVDVRDRKAERLERVRANIAANYERLSCARSAEYEARVQGWIDEGEETLASSRLPSKISSATSATPRNACADSCQAKTRCASMDY